MPTQINAFRSEDGSIHLTEGAAIRADVLHLMQQTAEQGNVPPDQVLLISQHGLAVIEQCLGKLLPLLNRLNDPRNKAPAKAPEPAPGEIDERTMEDVASIPVPGDKELVFIDQEFPAVDPSELRIGQLAMVEYISEDGRRLSFEGIVTDIDGDFNVTFHKSDVPGDWAQPFGISSITRIIKQPEDMMALDVAREELDQLPSDPDMTTPEGRLAYTRRILLNRRIAQLEKNDEPE